jgi:2-polyprenyl-3-methyl-5-hydroxy-6-metoxy-1,4-benzoquinol methylase
VAARVHPDLASLDAATQGRPFHAATLIEVLEHLDDPLTVLHLLYQRMVPGGILVVEVPNCEGVTDIRNEVEYDLVHPLEHINCFTPSTLRRFAARSGFTIARPPTAHVTTDPVRIIKTSVKKALLLLRPMTRFYFERT